MRSICVVLQGKLIAYPGTVEDLLQAQVNEGVDANSGYEDCYAPPVGESVAKAEIARRDPAPVTTHMAVDAESESDIGYKGQLESL